MNIKFFIICILICFFFADGVVCQNSVDGNNNSISTSKVFRRATNDAKPERQKVKSITLPHVDDKGNKTGLSKATYLTPAPVITQKVVSHSTQSQFEKIYEALNYKILLLSLKEQKSLAEQQDLKQSQLYMKELLKDFYDTEYCK